MSDVFPPLSTEVEGTDFNDLQALAGLDAVRDQLGAVQPAAPVSTAEPDQAAQWSEPLLPGVLQTPEVPASILPGVWGQMAQAVSESTQTPPVMSVLCALGVLSTLLQKRYEVDAGSHCEVLAFWGVSVSPSGTRKTAVMNAFQAPLLQWEKLLRDRMRRDIARTEAVRTTTVKRIESLKQQAGKADADELNRLRAEIEREEMEMPEELRAPLLFTEDVTPETLQRLLAENDGRMAVMSDEPGIFRILGGLYSGGSASLEVFLKGHTGSALKVARAARMVFVDKPCVSMNLMIQPDLVAELAGSSQFRSSGLLARFFYGVPVSNVGRRDVRQRRRISLELHQAYSAAVMALMEGYPSTDATEPKTQTLTLDELAEDAWLDFSQEIEDQMQEGGPFDGIRDWTSKLPGAVVRVAALLQLAEGGVAARVVSLESMVQAIELARLLIPHTQAAFGLLGADPVDADATAILKWIRAGGRDEFTQRDAQHAMSSRFRSADKLKKALTKLRDMGCVRLVKRANKGTNRSSDVVLVNPAVLS